MPFGGRILIVSLIALVLLVTAVAALVVDTLTHRPDFSQLKDKTEVTIVLAGGKKATRWVGPKTLDWVALPFISNSLLMAVIASEDSSYFQHEGVDYYELKEAIKKDLKEKRWARGASTITQQVVKNVYLGREKTLWRKMKEFIWARELNKALSKSEILCFYVNLVEWGPGIYGIKKAAQHYFQTTPLALTAKQSAFLAMLLPSPVKYHVYFEKKQLTPWAGGRVAQILRVMNRMRFVNDEEYQVALDESLWGEATSVSPGDLDNLPTEDEGLGNWTIGKPPSEEPSGYEPLPQGSDEPQPETGE